MCVLLLHGSLYPSCPLGNQKSFLTEIVTVFTYWPLVMCISFILARSWSYIFQTHLQQLRSKLCVMSCLCICGLRRKTCVPIFTGKQFLVLWIFNECNESIFLSFFTIQELMVTWMLQPTTSLPCSHHVTAFLTSPCTTTTPLPRTPLTYRWSSTWS